MKCPATLALLLLLAPVASAGWDVQEHHQHLATIHNDTGAAAVNVTIHGTHNWSRVQGWSTLVIRAAYVLDAGTLEPPEATFQAYWNNTEVPGCRWRIQGSNPSTEQQHAALSLECPLPSYAAPGNHTLETRQVEATGTVIQDATLSVTLRQTEAVDMDIDVRTHLDAFLPFLAWIAYVVLLQFLDSKWLRFLAGLLAFGILALPIGEAEYVILFGATVIVALYNAFKIFEEDP